MSDSDDKVAAFLTPKPGTPPPAQSIQQQTTSSSQPPKASEEQFSVSSTLLPNTQNEPQGFPRGAEREPITKTSEPTKEIPQPKAVQLNTEKPSPDHVKGAAEFMSLLLEEPELKNPQTVAAITKAFSKFSGQ